MSRPDGDPAFCSKNRLNILVIDQVAHLVFGPNPTDENYNSVAEAISNRPIHDDIARLADDIVGEADRMSGASNGSTET